MILPRILTVLLAAEWTQQTNVKFGKQTELKSGLAQSI
jgi:hypothetical protein